MSIEKYNEANRKLADFRAWSGLIGKEYFGGTRGKGGEYGRIVCFNAKPEIYSQSHDGATNYHKPDSHGIAAIETALMKLAPQILIEAEKILAEKCEKQLAAAKLEAQSILAMQTEERK